MIGATCHRLLLARPYHLIPIHPSTALAQPVALPCIPCLNLGSIVDLVNASILQEQVVIEMAVCGWRKASIELVAAVGSAPLAAAAPKSR